MKQLAWLSAIALFITALVACQSEPGGTRTVADSWRPTPQATQPAPPTLTPAPTATLIPITPLLPDDAPVIIPTMPPIPTPAGLYAQETTGFTMPFPIDWERDTSGLLSLVDPAFNLRVNLSIEFANEESSFEEFLDDFVSGELVAFFDLENVAVSEISEITVASGERAQTATVSGSISAGTLAFWFASVQKGPRIFRLTAFGFRDNIEARQRSLQTMVSQIDFVQPTLFGLNREETLVLLGGDPLARSLDPARATGSAAGYVGLLYSGLVRLSPELQVVPDLAETWAISEDGATYTFTLREGTAFSSGRPLTSADVVYSLERAADPQTGSTTAATYLGDILGVSEKLAGDAESIAGLEIVDDRTLRITLDGPKPYFLAKLTYPTAYIVDRESVQEDDEEWVFSANSSGAYVLRQFRAGEAILFNRNEHYHTPPAIAYVVYLTARAGSSLSLYEAGEVDIIGLGAADAEAVRRPSHPLHAEWVSATSMCTTFVQLNNNLAPFDDLNVRRAFALAVDKAGLNELLSEGKNLVATTILPPAMPGYSLALAQAAAGFDETATQAALAESAYADGLPPITLLAAGFGDSERNDLNALIDMWQRTLGADVTIQFVDPLEATEALRNATGHMVSYGWCADYPDPENFLDLLYHTGGDFNVSGYSNPAADALLRQARTALDPAERLALYQEAELLLLTDAAAIPLQHGVSDQLVKPSVQGYTPAAMGVAIIPLLSWQPTD